MDKETFYNNLIKATDAVYPFTCKMVINKLPNKYLYIVNIHSSFTEGLQEGELTYPEVKKLNQTTDPIDAKQVIDILWMGGAIPEWINIQVEDYDETYTYFILECCGRFSNLEEYYYHVQEGYTPFHCLSPTLPLDSLNDNNELIEKIDIRWNKKKRI